ncbi:MAG: DUF3791 domain-containing protein [Ignavibacteria bacterium]|nr:DUF3791 domain-containing protein [Ignavibacteria bacterium]
MSKLSFKSFCIEFYSEYKGMRSDEVFELFEKEGVLKLLDEDYEDLHGFGMEYLVRFIDEYLEGKAQSI